MKASLLDGRVKVIRAVIEVTLIAVGVLAGLLAEAWINSKAEQRLELSYLNALEAEVQANREWLSRAIAREDSVRRGGEAMIHLFESEGPGAEVPLFEFVDLFSFGPFQLVTATVDQLVASGDLSVLRRSELRTSLAKWAAEVRTYSDYLNREQWDNWNLVGRPFLDDHVGAVTYYRAWNSQDEVTEEDRTVSLSPRAAETIASRLVVAMDVAGLASRLQTSAQALAKEIASAR